MKTRRRRALSAEELSMTPEQRAEMREIGFRARANAKSSRYHADIRAITNGESIAKPAKDLK